MIESRCGIICSECSFREPYHCPGCVNTEKVFHGDCAVKICCESKKLEHCGNCENMPCETLKQYSFDKEHGDNGKRIEQCKIWAKG